MFKLFGKRALLALTFASTITTVVAEKPSGPWQERCWAKKNPNTNERGDKCVTSHAACHRGDAVLCEYRLCDRNSCRQTDTKLIVPESDENLTLCEDSSGYGLVWYKDSCGKFGTRVFQ